MIHIDQSTYKCTKRGLFLTKALLNVTLVKVLLRVLLRMFSWKLSDLLLRFVTLLGQLPYLRLHFVAIKDNT